MPAGKHDFICEQGASFIQSLFYRDADDVAIDITGYSAVMNIKTAIGGVVLDAYASGAEITITGATGAIDIEVADTVTALYGVGTYKYDLSITSPAGLEYRLMQGSFVVDAEVGV